MLWFRLATHFLLLCCRLSLMLWNECGVVQIWLINHAQAQQLNNCQIYPLTAFPVLLKWILNELVQFWLFNQMRGIQHNFICMLFHPSAVYFFDLWFCASRLIMRISWLHACGPRSKFVVCRMVFVASLESTDAIRMAAIWLYLRTLFEMWRLWPTAQGFFDSCMLTSTVARLFIWGSSHYVRSAFWAHACIFACSACFSSACNLKEMHP